MLLRDNPQSRYVEIAREFIAGLEFWDVHQVLGEYGVIRLKSPDELGIKARRDRDFRKEFIRALAGQNVEISDLDDSPQFHRSTNARAPTRTPPMEF